MARPNKGKGGGNNTSSNNSINVDKWVKIGQQNRERYNQGEALRQEYWQNARQQRQQNIANNKPKANAISNMESSFSANSEGQLGFFDDMPTSTTSAESIPVSPVSTPMDNQVGLQDELRRKGEINKFNSNLERQQIDTWGTDKVTAGQIDSARREMNADFKTREVMRISESRKNYTYEDGTVTDAAWEEAHKTNARLPEEAIENYDGFDTGRTVKKNVASDKGGFIPGDGPTRLEGGQAPNGLNGSYLDVEEVSQNFEERIRNLDAKKGTNYAGETIQADLSKRGINTHGASTAKGYRAAQNGIDARAASSSIPTEPAIKGRFGRNGAAVADAVENIPKGATGKAAQEGMEGMLKGMSKSKIGKTIAGVGVAALLVSNMNKSKGQQSNQELYGQKTPYM